jgi:L-fuconolactonase
MKQANTPAAAFTPEPDATRTAPHVKQSGTANAQPKHEWLTLRSEAALEVDLPIIDAHHHLWDNPHPRYLLDEIQADIDCGHNIRATVFVEAGAMWRQSGPASLRPVGEVEFASGIAAMSESGAYGETRLCAAIVGYADLSLGADVEPVLDALLAAGNGRLRGIRHSAAHDPEVRMLAPLGLLRSQKFLDGFSCLQRTSLGFELWIYHTQLDDAMELLKAFPEARVAINHIGGRIGIGQYAGMQAEVNTQWLDRLQQLSAFPNVNIKLSGQGMSMAGFGLNERPLPPTSEDLANLWWPRMSACLEIFGVERCMFASNFPVDKASCSYVVLWNAFKRMTQTMSPEERTWLFAGTAARHYSLQSHTTATEPQAT